MLIAITRAVSPSLADCELTHLAREPIDVACAQTQHAAYEATLASLGASIVRAPAAPEYPDAVFIEDAAVVLDEVAVITRPGAASRRGETAGVATVLQAYRPLITIDTPATLDGGDVLRLGRTLYVGRSSRTNDHGIAQLRTALKPFDYRVVAVGFSGCLHLKSAVSAVRSELLLINPAWVSVATFSRCEAVFVDEGEAHAANALSLGDALVYPSQYPRTRERLEESGLRVVTVDYAEFAKAEGGVTCCSLILG